MARNTNSASHPAAVPAMKQSTKTKDIKNHPDF